MPARSRTRTGSGGPDTTKASAGLRSEITGLDRRYRGSVRKVEGDADVVRALRRSRCDHGGRGLVRGPLRGGREDQSQVRAHGRPSTEEDADRSSLRGRGRSVHVHGSEHEGDPRRDGRHGRRVRCLGRSLVATLDEFNVPDAEKQELLGVLGPMRGEILEEESAETGTALPDAYQVAPALGLIRNRPERSEGTCGLSFPTRHAPRLLDPSAHLGSLRLFDGLHLDVAAPIGGSKRRRRSNSAPPKKTTFTETS